MALDLALALRLLRGAGRRDVIRLTAMALGVGFAVLACLVGLTAPRVSHRQHHVEVARAPIMAERATTAGLRLERTDAIVDDRPWTRVTVTGTAGARTLLPPGLSAWPAPGTTIVSPALRSLAAHDPRVAAEIGTLAPNDISPTGLTSPDELFSYTASTLGVTGARSPGSRTGAAVRVVGFGNPADVTAGTSASILTVEIVALVLTPVVLFLMTALRLSATSRTRRSFALGLAGMSPSRAARLYAWEMGVVGVLGFAGGAAAYAAAQPALGRSGLLGIRWWPDQGRLGSEPLALAGLLAVVTVTAMARRSMRAHLIRSRSEAAQQRVRLSTAPSILAFVVGVPAIAFLAAVIVRGRMRASDAWASGPYSLVITVAVVLAVGSVALGTPRVISGSGQLLAARLRPAYALGMRGAAYRAAAARRLIGFVACAVMIASLSAAFVTALHRTAFGDPAQATISFDLGQVRRDPDWVDRLPRMPWTIDTSLSGTDSSGARRRYAVVVGDCAAVLREDSSLYAEPGECRNTIQRATFSVDGTAARTVDVAGHPVMLPASDWSADGSRHSWDLKFPPRDAPWIKGLAHGQVTYWVSRTDGTYQAALAALTRRFPGLQVDAGIKDPGRYAAYRQQVGTVRAAACLGVILAVLSFVLTALESRWERTRSVATLTALGTRGSVLRTANAVEFAFPVLVAAVPATIVGVLSGWAVLSFWGTRGMCAAQVPAWALGGLVIAVLVAVGVGWATGGATFRREALSDS